MRPIRAILFLALTTLAPLSAPAPLAARDCGADYVRCLWELGALGTSDQLHETECYGDYVACVARLLRVY